MITNDMLMVILPLAASLNHNQLIITISMTLVTIKLLIQLGNRWQMEQASEIAVAKISYYLV